MPIETELKPVKVLSTDEPWTTIELADGNTIRVRLNITKVCAVFVDGQHLRQGDHLTYDIRWVAATAVEEKPDGKPN